MDRIEELAERLQELAPYTTMGASFSQEKTDEYYRTLREFQRLREWQFNEASIAKTPESVPVRERPFVNSFGEATTRYVTTTTYERQQRRLHREIRNRLARRFSL